MWWTIFDDGVATILGKLVNGGAESDVVESDVSSLNTTDLYGSDVDFEDGDVDEDGSDVDFEDEDGDVDEDGDETMMDYTALLTGLAGDLASNVESGDDETGSPTLALSPVQQEKTRNFMTEMHALTLNSTFVSAEYFNGVFHGSPTGTISIVSAGTHGKSFVTRTNFRQCSKMRCRCFPQSSGNTLDGANQRFPTRCRMNFCFNEVDLVCYNDEIVDKAEQYEIGFVRTADVCWLLQAFDGLSAAGGSFEGANHVHVG